MWLLANRAEPATAHHTFKATPFLYFSFLKYLLATSRWAEKVLFIITNIIFKFFLTEIFELFC